MPEMFVPMEQGRDRWNQLFLVARIDGEPMSAVAQIRQAVASIDPDQPVYAIQTLNQAFEASIVTQQVSAALLTIFAVVALALAAVGIYGVTAYGVRTRTQEIGIRMAMGAERSAVVWMVLRQVFALVAAGLTLGVGAVVALSPALASLLFGVSAIDPLTVLATASLLGAVALCGCVVAGVGGEPCRSRRRPQVRMIVGDRSVAIATHTATHTALQIFTCRAVRAYGRLLRTTGTRRSVGLQASASPRSMIWPATARLNPFRRTPREVSSPGAGLSRSCDGSRIHWRERPNAELAEHAEQPCYKSSLRSPRPLRSRCHAANSRSMPLIGI